MAVLSHTPREVVLKFLVVTPKGNACTVRVVSDGTDVEGEFESWALNTGDQILFVDTKMHKVLRGYHMFGNYESGAMYGYSYDEMIKIMTSKLGPSDRARYLALRDYHSAGVFIESETRAEMVIEASIGVGKFLIKTLIGVGKFLGWMLLIPLLIRIFSKPR